MTDFDPQALLAKKGAEVQKPKALPEGTYLLTVNGRRFDKSTEKKTNFVEFELIPTETLPDVDQTQLAAVLGDETLMSKKQKATFYITPDALFRIKDFGRACGLGDAVETLSMGEIIEECLNKQVCGIGKHSPNKRDPESPYFNLDSFAPVPA